MTSFASTEASLTNIKLAFLVSAIKISNANIVTATKHKIKDYVMFALTETASSIVY